MNNSRDIASDVPKLPGTILGIAKYKSTRTVHRPGPRKTGRRKTVESKRKWRAVRTYFKEVEGKPGFYNVIILEYVNLVKMAPKYIFSNKSPFISKKIGFLNQIAKRITVYRATPTAEKGKLEMQRLHYVNGVLEGANKAKPSMLVLSSDEANPLSGAKITAARDGEPVEIHFPTEEDEKGKQYTLARFTYEKVGLDSTWRMDYLPGPYLGAYYDVDDVILNLKNKNDKMTAEFIINKDRAHLSKKKREKQLTNKKSAYIKGSFEAKEVEDGIFVFEAVDDNAVKAEHVEGKLGLFIDIFDATKALNQDVVELVLVDSDKPEDFLMYYEHPENGDGQDHKLTKE